MIQFKTGDRVRIKGALDNKIWIIDEVSEDRECNEFITYMYNEEDESDISDIGWYPGELELVEDNYGNECKFPTFKSYGLTKEQVLEVVMLFIDSQISLHKELAWEAFSDQNYEWAADYFKDVQALLHIKMMEDKLYHRFTQE